MDYYTAVLFLNTFAMIIIQICVDKSNILTKKRKGLFKILFDVIIVAGICEWAAYYLENTGAQTRLLHILLKTIELSLAPSIGYLVAWIIEKRDEKIVYSILAINGILEIASAVFGFIFYVDDSGVYHHARFYWIYMAMYLASLCYCNFIIFKNTKKYQYNGAGYFLVLSLFMLTGLSIQFFNSSLKVDFLTLGISCIMLYVFALEMISQTDELSGLLNRRGFENYLSRIENPCIIIFFDVDDLKTINDQLGHAYGDIIIAKIGGILKQTYAKHGKCFRYGGDEFCALLNKNLDDIDALNQSFLERMEQARKIEKHLPNVSVGYSLYEPSHNHIDDVIKKADQNMYENKMNNKKR